MRSVTSSATRSALPIEGEEDAGVMMAKAFLGAGRERNTCTTLLRFSCRGFCGGIFLCLGKISGTGANGQLAQPLRFGLHVDQAIAALAGGLGGVVAERILITNIF